ncbi:MAG TPA: M3 family oligoendopeptidase [Candidatus Kapabacteria bacterium]
MHYKYYPNRPSKLTREFVAEEFSKFLSRIDAAERSETPNEWLSLYADWNGLGAYYSGEVSRIHYAHAQDMANAERTEADKYIREEVTPEFEKGNAVLLDAFLKSKHKEAIGKKYGPYLLQALNTSVQPQAPVNSKLRVKDSDLGDQYRRIVSQGEVEVNGETVTLAKARGLQSDSDPAIRKEAWMNYRKWFLDHHDALAGIFDNMVRVRTEMGRNVGHENFIPLGYLGMRRTDYGSKEVEAFRNAVREYATPLLKKLFAEQAEVLGTPTLKPWDQSYHPEFTLPTGIAPIEKQLDNAQQLFDEISPRLGEHFTRMRNEGLIDLENRKGKQAGAFCTSMPDEGRVRIFCNSTGDEGDVGTLVHEMGHAFQAWESQKIDAIDLQWPTSDGAEIHSMGMEFLSLPHLDWFFNPDQVQKFSRHHIYDVVMLMCYICVVDEFQHRVYEHPDATPEHRDSAWNAIWDKYIPDLDFSGIEEYKYARWYAQGHIFETPFYYIDYAIAQTAAMQLGMMDQQDHDKALDTYIKLCVLGGQVGILEIFKRAGLRSPFDPTTMRDLMDYAAKELGVETEAMAEAA